MKKIMSKVQPDLLLHGISRVDEITDGRADLSTEDEILQLAALKMPLGKTFKPHKHIYVEKKVTTTQESWVVIRGKVKVILYDIDDTIIAEEIIGPGDASITFRGGHNYLILEEGTVVYEYKTGPYYGQAKDKVFI